MSTYARDRTLSGRGGRRRIWLALLSVVAAILATLYGVGLHASSTASAPSAMELCPSCASLADLQNFAFNGLRAMPGAGPYTDGSTVFSSGGVTYTLAASSINGNAVPGGTVIVVVSHAYPLAAEFRYNKAINYLSRSVTYTLTLITTTDPGAEVLDNLLHARASDIRPISVPGTYGNAANQYESDEILEGFVNQILVFKGTPGSSGTNFWHALTSQPQVAWMTFTDTRTGKTYTLWNGDTVTLKFQDGSTIKVKLYGIGAPSGLYFQVVPGSARDPNGQPYGSSQSNNSAGGGNTFSCTPDNWVCSDFPGFPEPACLYQAGGCVDDVCTYGWYPCGS